jgi:hypothetical protein
VPTALEFVSPYVDLSKIPTDILKLRINPVAMGNSCTRSLSGNGNRLALVLIVWPMSLNMDICFQASSSAMIAPAAIIRLVVTLII